jgi:hypothetical protein
MIKTRVRTKFRGLVWVHEKYIDNLKEGKTILIEHDKKIMTVTPEVFYADPPMKGEESFQEQYGPKKGQRYHLYGFRFIPDENQDLAQKNADSKVGQVVAQCPECNAVKIALSGGKDQWQGSIAIFNNIAKELCYTCNAKTS